MVEATERSPYYTLILEQGTVETGARARLQVGVFADPDGREYVGVARQRRDKAADAAWETGKTFCLPLGAAGAVAALIAEVAALAPAPAA